jgi:hypothetical protein
MKINVLDKTSNRQPRVMYKDLSNNLLTDDQANCYPGIDGFSVSNGVLNQDLTRSHNDTGSAHVYVSANGPSGLTALSIPASPGVMYEYSLYTKAWTNEDLPNFSLEARFYNSGGTLLSTIVGPYIQKDEEWKGGIIWATAPANTATTTLTLVYSDMLTNYSYWWSDACVRDSNDETNEEGDVITSALPVSTPTINYYSTRGQRTSHAFSGCPKDVGGLRKRACYILDYLINSRIKYYYYTGHQLSTTEVIQDKKGNCCDLSRLVDSIAGSTSIVEGLPITTKRYVVGTITYQGADYPHVWNELYLDGKWYTIDATNYITSGTPQVLGTIKTITNRIYTGNPC